MRPNKEIRQQPYVTAENGEAAEGQGKVVSASVIASGGLASRRLSFGDSIHQSHSSKLTVSALRGSLRKRSLAFLLLFTNQTKMNKKECLEKYKRR